MSTNRDDVTMQHSWCIPVQRRWKMRWTVPYRKNRLAWSFICAFYSMAAIKETWTLPIIAYCTHHPWDGNLTQCKYFICTLWIALHVWFVIVKQRASTTKANNDLSHLSIWKSVWKWSECFSSQAPVFIMCENALAIDINSAKCHSTLVEYSKPTSKRSTPCFAYFSAIISLLLSLFSVCSRWMFCRYLFSDWNVFFIICKLLWDRTSRQ